MTKRSFKFEPYPGDVDIYVNGKKVRGPQRGHGGNIAFHISEDVDIDVTVAIHDPLIGIEFEITPNGLERIIREPKTLPTPVEAAKARAEAEAAKQAMEAAKQAELDAKVKAIKDAARARGIAAKKEKYARLGTSIS
jgi:hypothetical protein